MNNLPDLFLITDVYPVGNGEFFVDDELRVIASGFNNVFIFVRKQDKTDRPRFIPDNAIILNYYYEKKFLTVLISILSLLKSEVRSEIKFFIRKYNAGKWFRLFKIMFADYIMAFELKKQIEAAIKENKISVSNTVFYSYWHDYKALALSLFKQKEPYAICIARAHGWDVFSDRHKTPYLPFKNFIISSLNQTFSVSTAGKTAFLKLLGNTAESKITVSYLGKINERSPRLQKVDQGILICSCSNLIPLKRVHLIIDVLAGINLKNILWVHFGDGYLRKELERYAIEKLSHIRFSFRGVIPNEKILDFYNQNYVDLFINLSESEGIPVSIMEALSAGIPVLATDVGGTSEVVKENHGFLISKDFDSRDVSKLVDSYLNSDYNHREEFRNNAYNFWKENFNAEKNYKDFYEKLISLKK